MFLNPDERASDPIFKDRLLFDLEWLRNGESRPSGQPEPLVPVGEPHIAVLASSIVCPNGTLVPVNEQGFFVPFIQGNVEHMPYFDLDFPFKDVKVMESASGHAHLYINVPMSWDDVCILLDAFQKVGLLEAGWVKACKEQGMTRLRMPGVPKIKGGWGDSSTLEGVNHGCEEQG
jgi:hypothetical protein